MKKCDLHVHTEFSPDSGSEVSEVCAAAVKNNVDVIALTDHFELTMNQRFSYKFYLENEARRIETINKLKEKYNGKLKILYGVEVGQPHLFPKISEEFFKCREFDFVLGSVHILKNERDVFLLDYCNENYIDEIMNEYFDEVVDLINFGGFDSLAHMDLPLRMMEGKLKEPTVLKYREKVERVLESAAKNNLAVEINTRGLFCWQKEVGPEQWILKDFRALGGKYITTGSDAHRVQDVGRGIEQAMLAAKSAGFSDVAYFEKRKPVMIEI